MCARARMCVLLTSYLIIDIVIKCIRYYPWRVANPTRSSKRAHVPYMHNHNDPAEAWNWSLIACHFDLAWGSESAPSCPYQLNRHWARSRSVSPPRFHRQSYAHPLHQKLVPLARKKDDGARAWCMHAHASRNIIPRIVYPG